MRHLAPKHTISAFYCARVFRVRGVVLLGAPGSVQKKAADALLEVIVSPQESLSGAEVGLGTEF